MKLKILKNLAIFTLVITLGSSGTPEVKDDVEKNRMLIQNIMYVLSAGHYQAHKVDDQFSKNTFDLYIKQLDFAKRLLTADDLKLLKSYENQIDDQVQTGSYEFFDLSEKIVSQRIKDSQKYYKQALEKPFDFDKKEDLETDPAKIPFAKDSTELKEYWRKYLKYNTLTRLVELMQAQEASEEEMKRTNKKDESKILSFADLEKKAREEVLKNHDEWYERMKIIEKNDWLSIYLNSITGTYDPHTNYLPPQDKQNFDIQMSGKLEGIGATLYNNEGYVKVGSIVPGSPCWKEGQLAVGDKILKVAQGNAEPLDIVGMRSDHAVGYIRGKKGTEVKLTVKKKDNSVVVISIIRDVIEIGETYARSAILKDEKDKVGYIHLPKFYADFGNDGNDESGRFCARDVRKELEKFKKENAKGVILDLRSNGGGSLQEVIDMVGLFIKSGPVVQVKGRDAQMQVHSDRDPALVYDAPLVVLVNPYSASASEILAAAIQDYGRGVIIGSSPTFGKGTVQRVLDLDGLIPESMSKVKPLGSIKLTLQKYYRINGETVQLKGVQPDIILPDSYSYLEIGEKEQDYPLAADVIPAAQYEKWNKAPNMKALRENSEKRLKSHETFKLVTENALRLKKQKDFTLHTLNLKQYREELKKAKEETEKYNAVNEKVKDLDIESLLADVEETKTDSIKTATRTAWLKTLKKDFYLQEALNVIKEIK
ncbi:MAG: tail-specific protease [Bacteroidetes bacterium]|nr:MAG: tail-specific protease [Bacteroidota bacterium]